MGRTRTTEHTPAPPPAPVPPPPHHRAPGRPPQGRLRRRETTTLGKREAAAFAWIRDHSLPVATLDEPERRSPLIRRSLDARTLTIGGKPAAATTIARKRAVFYGVLNYAVELDILPANPVEKVAWKAPEVAEEVDRRVVSRPRQVRALLAAVEQLAPELTAFFGCLYYGCMRLGEAVILRQADCVTLPASGWGLLLLSGNAPRVGSQWTDSGMPHDRRHLKHRARKTTRPVPIPPELVELLRNHLERFGTTPDGRLFRGARGRRSARAAMAASGSVSAGKRSPLPGPSRR